MAQAQPPPSPPTVAPRVRRSWLRTFLIPLAVLVAGLSACTGLFVSGWREQRRADAANFDRLAASAEADILQRVDVYRDALRAGAGFLRASREVSRREWREFAGSLDLARIHPGLEGIGVIYPVAAAGLETFLQRARADGEPGFAVRLPPGGQPGLEEHAIITFIEPQIANLEAVGLDVWSESNRRAAALAARDSGAPRLTRRIRLVQDGSNRAGFLLYLPVYRAGSAPTTIDERRRDHQAWIYAPFIFEELLNRALADRAGQLRLWVYEGDDMRPEDLLHASDVDAPGAVFARRSRLEIAGVPFMVGWARGREYVAAGERSHMLTALSGAGASVLLAGLILSLQTTGRRARQLAAERTAEVRAAQRELEAANRLQRAVLDGTVFSVISTRPDGVIATFNAGAERMLGYTRDEVVGRFTPELIHDRDEVAARARALTAELGRPVEPGFEVFVARARLFAVDEREWTYLRKDGSRLPVWLSVTALRDEAGEITGFLGLATDLTDRKQAEEKIVRSERLVRAVADGLPGMVAYWTRDLRCTFSNHAYLHWFGRTSEEMNGIRMQDLLGEKLFRANEPYIRGALAGVPQQFERTLTKANGEVGYTWAQYVPDFAPDGVTVNGFFVLVADITDVKRAELALRESEARTRLFAEHAPASVAMFDREMRYLVHSRQWLADYHLDGQNLLGRSHYEVFPEIGAEWKAIHQRCLAGAVERCEADLFVRQDGSRQWLSWEVRPWHTPTGEIGGIVMLTQDITRRKELEENLAKARDEALEASRLKSDFLATMSHEIRTPMNAIVGMAGLLADTPLNAEQREMLRAVSGGAEGLLVIINDALDLSRIEAGQLRLDPTDFDLVRVIEETVALLAPAAHEKRLELTCEIDPAPDRLLLGDAGRVRQILMNLIGNAVKFTAAGEVAVLARAGAGAGDRTRVRIEIRDTGIGIPDAARSRVFEPFAQVDGSSTRRFGGTGLGLAITRQLVAAMGGEIGFASEVGRGSVFRVDLEFDRRGPRPVAVANVPAGHRVLVVDDHPAQRAILLRQLARCGVEGEAVGDGATALARLRQPGGRPWSLVLLDWEMAPVNGVELAAEIRADPAGAALPLILLAPAAGGADVISALGPEFAAVLTKPVPAQKLARCLGRVLGGEVGEPAATPAPPAVRPARGLRVLLAEDNAANQRVASLLLERMGHTVELAANGAIALERLSAEAFDAVLMDCQMPVLDGYEATRRVRSGALPGVNPRVPVIALTAYARPEDRAQCLAAGMDGHVSKPIRPAELQAALSSCRAGRAAGPLPESGSGLVVLDRHTVEIARGLPGRDGGTLLAEMVGLYRHDESARLERLRRLEEERRGPELAEEAHAFGSNAAALGAVGVRQVALQLEAAARAADWPAAAAAALDLTGACAQLRDALQRLNVTDP